MPRHHTHRMAHTFAAAAFCALAAMFTLTGGQCGAPNTPGGLVAEAGNDKTITTGESIALNGSASGGVPPYTFTWTATGFAGSSEQTPTVSPTTTTVFTLTVQDSDTPPSSDQDTVAVTVFPVIGCGDGNLDTGEECDDGNNANGDGCDENCVLEPCTPGDWRQAEKIVSDDGDTEQAFGWAVSVGDDAAVVGARDDSELGLRAGAAYVFLENGEQIKLVADDAIAEDRFGSTVSISGEVVIVGVELRDDNGNQSGAAYVYRKDGDDWVQEQKLLPSDAAAGHLFGSSVSVSGNTALIGAPGKDSLTGAVYVYDFDGTTWQQGQTLLAGDGSNGNTFGNAVSLDGNVAVIGAYQDTEGGDYAVGSAYVFRFDGTTWQEEQKLLADDGARNDRFGSTVGIAGDLAVVGAADHDAVAEDSGAAYVFRRDAGVWTQEKKLVPDDGALRHFFGWSVAIDGEIVVAGSPADTAGTGSAYVFRRNGGAWDQDQKLQAINRPAAASFGTAVSIFEEVILIGANTEDTGDAVTGSAYFFDVCP